MSSDKGGFVHLHNHTEYSMLDGAARITELCDHAVELGMTALAITDHGNPFGVFDFWRTARERGLKPIIGLEAYLTPGTKREEKTRISWGDPSQKDDDISGGGAYTHMTMWAENTGGMHNLFRLSSHAAMEGFYFKPRMDREILESFHEGIIATTGCPSGEVQTRIRLGQYDEALAAAAEFRDIFGEGNFYVEVMNHGLDIERRVHEDLLRIAKELNLPIVATNDLHYTHAEDASAHEALLCVQSASTLSDPKRFKFDSEEYFLKPAQQMRTLWADLPEACDSTLEIAERCDVHFTTVADGANYMPHFPDIPDGEDETSWFVREVEKGLAQRYPQGIPDEVNERARYEVGVITQMGFAGYYLIVADFIAWARKQGIRVGPGRGSGAGSMAAYALRITDLDPIEHGLLFERFLNPERVSNPDFDIDFDDRRRDEVKDYVTRKYGADRVSQIVTFGTIKAKQALKDSARVLGFPFSMGEKLTKALPPTIMGKDMPLGNVFDPQADRYEEADEFRRIVDADPDAQRVIATARGLENLKRQWGVHAAGVIMSSAPLMDVIPIMRREADGATITQFKYEDCEELGLVKMDFLGLRNLTILDDALQNIIDNGGEAIELETLPLDDAETYAMVSTGETLGVFQLDSSGMRALLRILHPDSFEDISAVQALYRPGPMGAKSHTKYALRKNNQQESTPIHPELAEPLAEILDVTHGLIVYQEQVMAIAQKVAGFSLGRADVLRRAMGKKKKKELDAQYEDFSAGMKERGYSAGAIKDLWDTLIPFSDYAFNKSHSAAYGLVSYWTAYLKTHYPTEYMAALLTSVRGDKDKSALYLNECRRMGITVLPPDVNDSSANFTPVGSDIRFGLTAIKNVGVNVVDAIVQTRQKKGRYESFVDFLDKVPVTVCNKRTIESLIKAGAFDELGSTRRSLMLCHEEAVDSVIGIKRNEAMGQDDLFGEVSELKALSFEVPDLPEWEKRQKLLFEREMLGLYVSDHPLFGLEHVLRNSADTSIAEILVDEMREDGAVVTIAGLITQVQRKMSKNGNPYAIVTIEDLEGSIDVKFFTKAYVDVDTRLIEDTVVVVRGRITRWEDAPSIMGMEMSVPNMENVSNVPVTISISASSCTKAVIERLKRIFSAHPGMTEVRLKIKDSGRSTVMRIDDGLRVAPSPAFFGDLKALLGPSCLS